MDRGREPDGELLGEKIDTLLLTECRPNQHPQRIRLDRSVPVLVVYMPVEANANVTSPGTRTAIIYCGVNDVQG